MLLTKGEFARRRGVTPAAVSQWISGGKISGHALVGEGRYAKIDVAEAERQLSRTLDPGQQLGRAAPAPEPEAPQPAPTPTPAPASHEGGSQGEPDDQDRYRRIKTESAELELRRQRRRELEELGHYMVATTAREAWAKELGGFIQAIETWFSELALTLAAERPTDTKEMTALIRREWRAFRQKRSDLARAAAAREPDLVSDDDG